MSSNDGRGPASDLACRELVEVVTDYLEGRLPPDDVRRFDEHLRRCRGCTNYVEQMGETIRLAGTLTENDVSPEARDALLAAFRDWKGRQAGRPPSR